MLVDKESCHDEKIGSVRVVRQQFAQQPEFLSHIEIELPHAVTPSASRARPLAVIPMDVADKDVHRDLASERGVGSLVIV